MCKQQSEPYPLVLSVDYSMDLYQGVEPTHLRQPDENLFCYKSSGVIFNSIKGTIDFKPNLLCAEKVPGKAKQREEPYYFLCLSFNPNPQ